MIAAGRSRFGHVRAETADFVRRVWNKADQDQIFFMASAIAFNILICIVPLALAALGIAGLISRNIWYGDPTYPVMRALTSALPNVSAEFVKKTGDLLTGIFASAGSITLYSILGLTWFATRLIGTLRTALREIFDLQQDRTIILGKLFDIKMVVVAGSLNLNVGVTVLINAFVVRGRAILNVQVANSFWNGMIANFTAFLSIWTMFLLIYRYLPARRISWRTAMISTTFASIMFEFMKRGFAVYAARTNYGEALYSGLAVAAILIIWVYYTAVAFILGGEVGQVYTLRRIRKRQKERLV